MISPLVCSNNHPSDKYGTAVSCSGLFFSPVLYSTADSDVARLSLDPYVHLFLPQMLPRLS